MSSDEDLAQEDQNAARGKDGKSCSDAAAGNYCLAHPALGQDVSISLRASEVNAEKGRPAVVEGGFRRHWQQESFSKKGENAFESPKQDKGVILVGQVIPWQAAPQQSPPPLHRTRHYNIKNKKGKIIFETVETFVVEPFL